MAAARWDGSPGAGSRLAAVPGGAAAAYKAALQALEGLAAAIPHFKARLQTREQLDARQRSLAESGGSDEKTGAEGEEVQLRVSERIGVGTFCAVFRGALPAPADAKGRSIPVATKFELRKNDSTQLRNEFRMYKKLVDCHGIARVYTFGEMDLHKVLVMDLLGPSLESLFQACNRRFSVRTVARLATQMITRVQAVHECGIIYRDIKPENFLMGLPGSDSADMVYLVDFGMAKPYRDPDTLRHIPNSGVQSLSGTARYMSINAHCRRVQSRRDDLEALGYVLLYFALGSLPWQGAKAPTMDARYDQMCETKQATSIAELCRGVPPGFAAYVAYTRRLAFDADPDYDFLRGLFTTILDASGAADDSRYDWAEAPAPADGPGAALRPATPPEALPQDAQGTAAADAAVSPPGGKRRRSESASDARPPTRARAKTAAYAFYDSDAQRALATLYRDVIAKRYSIHRAVKQSSGGARMRSAFIAQAFTEALDKTLSSAIAELEDMADRLLRDGEWEGAARVCGWLDEAAAAVADEIARLKRTHEAGILRGGEGDAEGRRVAAAAPPPPLPAAAVSAILAQPAFAPADPLEVDDEDGEVAGLLDAATAAATTTICGLRRPPYVVRPPAVDRLVPRGLPFAHAQPPAPPSPPAVPGGPAAYTLQGGASPAAAVRTGMGSLSLAMDGVPPLEVDTGIAATAGGGGGAEGKIDVDGSAPDSEVMELVYRTASGTRKVLRLSGQSK